MGTDHRLTQSTDQRTARTNNATRGVARNMDDPFAEGAFRYLAKGEYTEGQCAGQDMVVKWFKTGPVFEAEFYDMELEVGCFDRIGIGLKPGLAHG